ncbi:MAG: peptidoglycan bridge formation glycyltransferase FemA/FemB family protein [Bifidobacteriaceae bacterium]|jgi:lipid II:glycine glycyltransferase (peptidoglycan interpeptide bridge formation enzyme)|nr:peptidoglycan bridge formation glycyltransferase FemA/FemB family protein [Bifidobacteriaceae bacterium]
MSHNLQIEQVYDLVQWDKIINSLEGHPLQLSNWGELKAKNQWSVNRIAIYDSGKIISAVQILTRKLPFPFKAISHIPRGPIIKKGESEIKILNQISKWIKTNLRSIAIICEVDFLKGQFSYSSKWSISKTPILFNKTLIIDLNLANEKLYSNLNRKNRNHIRHAEAAGVKVKIAKTKKDVEAALSVYKKVAARAGFALHNDSYFYNAFELGIGPLYIGYIENKAVSFLWEAQSNKTCFELWGGANEEGQKAYANNLVKWFAICNMKKNGVSRYDMNGLLNAGITNFKKSFEKREDVLVESHTLILNPLYYLYTLSYKALKLFKKFFK